MKDHNMNSRTEKKSHARTQQEAKDFDPRNSELKVDLPQNWTQKLNEVKQYQRTPLVPINRKGEQVRPRECERRAYLPAFADNHCTSRWILRVRTRWKRACIGQVRNMDTVFVYKENGGGSFAALHMKSKSTTLASETSWA